MRARFENLKRWVDSRTGIRTLLRAALDEPIPGGARLAYVFGSGLLFLFLSQVITGVFLALYYCPSPDHAQTTVAYILKEVSSGAFLRSLHAYGSSGMIIVLGLHFGQTFLFGSYKGKRELLWFSGCILSALILGMAFTGYLLPWDQKAYFATTVGTNIVSEIPLIGDGIKRLIRGGNEVGGLTLSRFFVIHVFVLPAAIFGLVAAHIFLFRKAGAAGPIHENPFTPALKAESFYPKQVLLDMGFALSIIAILGSLAHFATMDLGPIANPADTQYLPRPEWYYRPLFQWYKYWNGPWIIVGIIIVPLIVVAFVIGLPFIDRGVERAPMKRRWTIGALAIVFASVIVLGGLSYRDDRLDPSIAAQLSKQEEETKRFMRSPFTPVMAEKTVAPVNSPQIERGKKLFEKKSCSACHGEGGIGTAVGTKLGGISEKYTDAQLAQILKNPSEKMKAGGMVAVQLSDEDLSALIGYLGSLK